MRPTVWIITKDNVPVKVYSGEKFPEAQAYLSQLVGANYSIIEMEVY